MNTTETTTTEISLCDTCDNHRKTTSGRCAIVPEMQILQMCKNWKKDRVTVCAFYVPRKGV